MVNTVSLRGIRHTYPAARRAKGGRQWALDDVEFAIGQGQVLGLLGPNGAGKTTLVKIISTLLVPTQGSVFLFNNDALAAPHPARRRLGMVLGGDRGLYERLSAYDNLRFFAELYGLPSREARARIAEVLRIVGLQGEERRRVEQYSRGMKQRLHIARGILHRPDLLLLDEPTIGVDPVGARDLRLLVQRLNATGVTILLTTHYMYEAEQLASALVIINGGRVIASGTAAEIRTAARVQDVVEGVASGLDRRELDKITAHPASVAVDVEDYQGRQRITVGLRGGAAASAQDVVGLLESLGVRQISRREASLEDAYVELVTAPTAGTVAEG